MDGLGSDCGSVSFLHIKGDQMEDKGPYHERVSMRIVYSMTGSLIESPVIGLRSNRNRHENNATKGGRRISPYRTP
jgi:hypothetical protein